MTTLRTFACLTTFGVSLALGAVSARGESVGESARQIPVVRQVDVVVVGGSLAGVAAAIEAAGKGSSVLLAAPRSYLGDDVCATQRLWLETGEVPAAPLAKALFGDGKQVPTPMHIKRTLDEALLSAKVDFLFNCYVTDILRDAQGEPCGIVMANRSGRQAVLAKQIVDATDRAVVARLAGAKFAAYPAGTQEFRRVVVGGEPSATNGDTVRKLPFTRPAKDKRKTASVYECTLRIAMPNGSWAAFAAAEQTARDRTFSKAQLDASEVLFQIPPDAMQAAAAFDGPWPGAEQVSLDAFRPAGVSRLMVTGPCAAVSRKAAEALVRPLASLDLGRRVGTVVAAEAKKLPAIANARLPGNKIKPSIEGDVRELLVGLRPVDHGLPTVPSEARALPVLGSYDVVVIGGGTGGAAVGIGAARQGAKTLVVEQLSELGGVGTVGAIQGYYSGYREGFTAEVTQGVRDMGLGTPTSWSGIGKSQWWRHTNRQAGAEVWINTLGAGAVVAKGKVCGAVVVTPHGRGIVLARMVVDGTGSSDIAVAAGSPYHFIDGSEPAVQGAGMHTLGLGMRGPNTDFTFSDDTDMLDTWQLLVAARAKSPDAYDAGQLPQTRERRRIVGEVCLMPMDLVLERSWPDNIAVAKSHFDSHGFTVHPMFWARQPDIELGSGQMYVPLRAIVPKDLPGILVTSLGLSAHRDIMPILRMQANLQNLGYAAGTAAAMMARDAHGKLDLAALQRHLVEKGCLPAEAAGARDAFPPTAEQVQAAVVNVVKNCHLGHVTAADWRKREFQVDAKYNVHDIAIIFSAPDVARPMLEKAFAAATAEQDRLLYAHLLGILGSASGLEVLAAHVQKSEGFDSGWNFKGLVQYGRNLSEIDQFLVALGSTRDRRAVDAVLAKARLLDPKKEFSHHRACALALEMLGDPRAAQVLAGVLAQPGMTGYAATNLDDIQRLVDKRSESLREIMLARALYRCGDHQGVGRAILEQYRRDLRGPYARHAAAVLSGN